EIEVQDVPDVDVGNTQAHRCQLAEEGDRVEHDGVDTCPLQYGGEILQLHTDELGIQFPTRITDHVEAVASPDFPPKFGQGACGKLPFAERYEPEAGGPNEGFAIRDAEKHRFMSARLHPTCECSHRVHVPRERHAHEAKLHTFSPQISRRPWWRPWWPPLFSPLRPWIRRSPREVTRRRIAG